MQSTKQKLNLFSNVKTAKQKMIQALDIAKFTMNDIKKENFTLKLSMLSAILLRFKLPNVGNKYPMALTKLFHRLRGV